MLPDTKTLRLGWRGLCPRCERGSIFKPGLSLDLVEKCPDCELDLSKNDSADGPAVFLIFILGFSLVPLALAFDAWFNIALWVHVVLWGVIGLGLIIASLKPIKSYVIALQYKYRPGDWENSE